MFKFEEKIKKLKLVTMENGFSANEVKIAKKKIEEIYYENEYEDWYNNKMAKADAALMRRFAQAKGLNQWNR